MHCIARTILPLAFGLVAVACASVDLKGGHGVEETYHGASAWPFAPAAMRVHPFTSIELDENRAGLVLEARVELLDRVGDTTKGVGDFRFELYRVARTAGASATDQLMLYSWDASITLLEDNRRHYDSITRTYQFLLRLDTPPPADARLLLVVQFTDPGGRRLAAEAELPPAPSVRD